MMRGKEGGGAMNFYAGVDLGKRKSHIKIINQSREVIEDLKIDNDPENFKRIFRKYRGEINVACEATSNAFWVFDTLEPLVRSIKVGDTKKIRWIAEARIKTDRIDAGILAELLRVDLFPAIAIPPRRIRELRELARGLVRMRRLSVRLRNQVHAILGRHGVKYERKEAARGRLAQTVAGAAVGTAPRVAADSVLRIEEAGAREAKHLEAELRKELKAEPGLQRQVELLQSIPGVGVFSAALFVTELWDVSRFVDERHLASYIGFVPSTYQTGETCYSGRMTKQGNSLLRWILVQDAWRAVATHWFFGKLYERYRSRLGKSRALIPVARALLKTVFRVWTEGKPYEELYGEKNLVG
jgi:transposase